MGEIANRDVASTNDQPAESQADVVVQQRIETSATWTGPLPPPAALAQYESILPGAADRIISMSERQMDHRIQLEQKVVGGDSTRSNLGLAAAFIVAVIALLGSIYVIDQGYTWAGVAIFGIDIVGLASVFVHGTRARRAERERKAERVPQSNTD